MLVGGAGATVPWGATGRVTPMEAEEALQAGATFGAGQAMVAQQEAGLPGEGMAQRVRGRLRSPLASPVGFPCL